MQVFTERGNQLPVSANNISDHILSFQEITKDGFAPESWRVAQGGTGHVSPGDKTFFIRHAMTNKVFMQDTQNRFFRSFELILSSAEKKAIRAKPLFLSATEFCLRIKGKLLLTDFTVDQHDESFSVWLLFAVLMDLTSMTLICEQA